MTNRYFFLWLQNKCNVGYAFINMISPSHIISFYQVEFSILCFVVSMLFNSLSTHFTSKKRFQATVISFFAKLASVIYLSHCLQNIYFLQSMLIIFRKLRILLGDPAGYNLCFCMLYGKLVYLKLLQAFNGKKWEKFNSEKVASLAYARIQGKVALVTHFQNSNLMNEDKRCRPILFQSEGQSFGDKVTKLS